MIKRLDRSLLWPILLISTGFVVYGYSTSVLKVTDFVIFCIFVLAFDLLYGHMGRLSFGHMLYLGAGSYGAGLCAKYFSSNPFIALICGILLGAAVGALLAPVVVRTTGACFALLNLAFNQVGYFLVLVPLARFTGGEDGLSLNFASYPFLDFNNLNFRFLFSLAGLVLVMLLILSFVRSPYGMLLQSIKENEIRAQFLGYSTYPYKMVAFVLSTGIAGFAGALNTINYNYTNPSFIDPTRNVEVIFAALMGGAGNVTGAVIGGAVFMTISNSLARYIVRWEMFLGVALLIIAFKFRKGIWGYIREI